MEVITEVFSFAKNYSSGKNPGIVVSPEISGCTVEYEYEEKTINAFIPSCFVVPSITSADER